MNAPHVRRAGARRRALGLAVVGATAGVLGVSATGLAGTNESSEKKVTICHRTDSMTNPYVMETVNKNAIINQVSGETEGHGNHVAVAPDPPKKGKWSDVIPPFSLEGKGPAEGKTWQFAGLEMPKGQALIDNGCFPLGIKKTGDATVLPNGTINYQVVVTNLGFVEMPFAAIQVMDKNVELKPPADPPKYLEPGASATWTGMRTLEYGLEACGRNVKNTAKVRIVEESKGPSSRRNRSGVRSATEHSSTTRMSTWTTGIICPLDVGILKTSTQATVEPGGTVTYTVRVTNPGPIPLPTAYLAVTDPTATTFTPPAEMPKGLKQDEFIDWTATKSVAAGTEVCNTNVENTASVKVNVPEPSSNGTTSTSRRAKKAQNGQPLVPKYTSWPKEPVVATATPILVTGAICPPVTPSSTPTPSTVSALRPAGPSLAVTKTGRTRMLAGGRVIYTVTVTNTGDADAQGVVLRDQPPGVFKLMAVPNGAQRDGRAVVWNIGTLAAGKSVSGQVRFMANRTAKGRACNVALASATGLATVRDRACTTIVAAARPATPVTG